MPEADSETRATDEPRRAPPSSVRWFIWAVMVLIAFNVILFGKFILAYFSK